MFPGQSSSSSCNRVGARNHMQFGPPVPVPVPAANGSFVIASNVTPDPNNPNTYYNAPPSAANNTMLSEQSYLTSWQHMTRTIAHYDFHEQIGQGTYGQVYRATCKDTGAPVALKKMRVHHGAFWGMPQQLIREIKILKRLRHPNLLKLTEVVTSKGVEHLDPNDEYERKTNSSSNNKPDKTLDAREGYKGNLFLVLEYVSHDLTGLMDVAYKFTPVQVKVLMRQLLEAIAYMHEQKYVHRDIKSSNILLDSQFRLKLADFGLARSMEPPLLDQLHDRASSLEMTNKVITLWYRPPEILVGATKYGTAVDVFSAGCILAELILGRPLFPGKTEMDQLNLIMELLGTPNKDTWDYILTLIGSKGGTDDSMDLAEIQTPKLSTLRDRYVNKMSVTALNLLDKLLDWDPRKRLTAANALKNRYFWTQPVAPDDPAELGCIELSGGHFHEFQTKKKRREAKEEAEKAMKVASHKGMSESEAKDEYDSVYKHLMNRVAMEGLETVIVSKSADWSKDSSRGSSRDRDKRSSKHSKEEDSEKREKKREDRKRKSDGSGDDEKRRKQRREEKESRERRRLKHAAKNSAVLRTDDTPPALLSQIEAAPEQDPIATKDIHFDIVSAVEIPPLPLANAESVRELDPMHMTVPSFENTMQQSEQPRQPDERHDLTMSLVLKDREEGPKRDSGWRDQPSRTRSDGSRDDYIRRERTDRDALSDVGRGRRSSKDRHRDRDRKKRDRGTNKERHRADKDRRRSQERGVDRDREFEREHGMDREREFDRERGVDRGREFDVYRRDHDIEEPAHQNREREHSRSRNGPKRLSRERDFDGRLNRPDSENWDEPGGDMRFPTSNAGSYDHDFREPQYPPNQAYSRFDGPLSRRLVGSPPSVNGTNKQVEGPPSSANDMNRRFNGPLVQQSRAPSRGGPGRGPSNIGPPNRDPSTEFGHYGSRDPPQREYRYGSRSGGPSLHGRHERDEIGGPLPSSGRDRDRRRR
jgi:cyclin-dependent kinase 12/13